MSHVEQAFMERRWAWLTKSVLWSTGGHWKQRFCYAAATVWGCIGWYGWARLFYLMYMSISCQEAQLHSEISTLYEEHMLQHSPLPNRFCSGSGNPRRLLWLALVSSQSSLTTDSGLNFWHISPLGITTWFVIAAGRWQCWRKGEYNSFPNAVYICWCFFVAPGIAVVRVVTEICCGGENSFKCQLLLLCPKPDCDRNIDTSNVSKSV